MAMSCKSGGSECNGCMRCQSSIPECPNCGDECNTYYVSDGNIIGCENCIVIVDAYSEEFE